MAFWLFEISKSVFIIQWKWYNKHWWWNHCSYKNILQHVKQWEYVKYMHHYSGYLCEWKSTVYIFYFVFFISLESWKFKKQTVFWHEEPILWNNHFFLNIIWHENFNGIQKFDYGKVLTLFRFENLIPLHSNFHRL